MASITKMAPITYSDLANLIPQKYDKKVRDDRRQKEFWGKFAGPEGSQNAIIEKTDLQKEAGDRIHMETISELYKPGVSAETELSGAEEKYTINRFTVALELYRHAVAVTHKGNSMAIIDSINRAAPKLGRWFANKYDDLTFAEILDPTNATAATLYGGTAISDATLATTSRMSPDELDKLGLAMRRRGALPIQVINDKQDDAIELYALVMSEVDWYWLQRNSTFRSILQNSLPRGYSHPLLTGSKGMYNGIVLLTYNSIHMGCFQGTAIRPEVVLVGNHTSSATTLTVGSSETGYDYTKYFPQGTSGVDFTARIMADGSNDAEDITGCNLAANNYQITCDSISNNHLANSRIVFQNHRSRCICFGAEVAARAWGEKDTVITNTEDYGMNRGVGLMSTLGIAVIESSSGSIPNAVQLHTYADLPDASTLSL